MACWLLHSGFASEHAEAFYKMAIDYSKFVTMTNDDLTDIGVSSQLKRLKLLRIIEQIKFNELLYNIFMWISGF